MKRRKLNQENLNFDEEDVKQVMMNRTKAFDEEEEEENIQK